MAKKNGLGRRYRRFRSRNQYDKPLLIFVGDLMVVLSRNLPLIGISAVGALATLWFLGYFSTNPENEPSLATTANATIDQHSSIPGFVKIGDYWRKIEEPATKPPTGRADAINKSADTTPVVFDGDAKIKPVDSANRETSNPVQRTKEIEKPELVDESWIMTLDSESYVLQFGSSKNTNALKEFIPSINHGEPIAVYPFKQTSSGTVIYGIATGVYRDTDAAFAALEKYPKKAQAYDPWIRKVSDLTNQIELVKKNSNK